MIFGFQFTLTQKLNPPHPSNNTGKPHGFGQDFFQLEVGFASQRIFLAEDQKASGHEVSIPDP